MPHVTMFSSAIRTVEYDEARQHLVITLANERTYRYLDVPPEIYRAFLAAGSKGRYYNDHIRDVYIYERL
jgi:KTSC domain-containing protein